MIWSTSDADTDATSVPTSLLDHEPSTAAMTEDAPPFSSTPPPTWPPTTALSIPHSSETYFEWVVLAIGVTGTVANGLMLFVLAFFKKNRQQPTNKLILNQTSLDLLGCIAIVIGYSLSLGKPYFTSNTIGHILCGIFSSGALYGVGLTGSSVGLVMIALERYSKIVHPVLHKRYYRSWMLYAAIAIPWVYSMVTLIPVISVTMIIVDGACWNLGKWPHATDRLNYGIVVIVGNFIVPIAVFAYCYGRIAVVIRSRAKVTAVTSAQSEASRKKKNARQTNGVRTMGLIAFLFFICWLPIQVYYIMLNDGYEINVYSTGWYAVNFVCFINVVLNPVMYAWQYETVRESTRRLLRGGAHELHGEADRGAGRETTLGTGYTAATGHAHA